MCPGESALVYGIFKRFASLERRILRGLDLDLCAGARIAPDARSALAHDESAKSYEGNGITLFQRLLDGFDDSFDSPATFDFGQASSIGHSTNKFCFIHLSLPYGISDRNAL